MRGLFATPKDIQIIEGISYHNAWEKYQVLKDVFKKEKHQKITITEFLHYFGITDEDYNRMILSFKQ
jgi:hypothetical protein